MNNDTLTTSPFWILNKKLVLTYGVNAALLMAELLSKYEFYKKEKLLDEEGYFFIASENIEKSTGLSYRRKQYPIIKKFKEDKLLYTKRKGNPYMVHVKINFNILKSFLGGEYIEAEVEKKNSVYGKDKFKTTKELNESIELIYSKYPAKCPIRKASNGKSTSHKNKIKTLLKSKTKNEILEIIKVYVNDCIKDNTYMKNFGTFLNNLPELEEVKPKENSKESKIDKIVKWLSSNYMMKAPDEKSNKAVEELEKLGYDNKNFMEQFKTK